MSPAFLPVAVKNRELLCHTFLMNLKRFSSAIFQVLCIKSKIGNFLTTCLSSIHFHPKMKSFYTLAVLSVRKISLEEIIGS